ncbi:FAD-binding domain-containing protein [Camillea tinctor]|nr:FAD-binding domain-containing protein [Camillea tinctor]
MEFLVNIFLLLWVTFPSAVHTTRLRTGRSEIQTPNCKNIPGDLLWPSDYEWAQLNNSVNGRLIAATPIATVCHGLAYNADACTELQSTWSFDDPHLQSPVDILAPYFQNQSCDPFTPQETPCRLGNYASYSINVSNADDIQAGLQFVRDNNIRLTVKSTGHDLLGKSTGKGALSLWMHNLKTIEFYDECTSGPKFRGPCVKVGAGVIFDELFSAADSRGWRVPGSSCPTVAMSGGFAAGGGHGLLSSLYGMAADSVLEWEVVTADGDHIFARPDNHEDLYWALSGGGPGTFAVVLSLKIRVYPDEPISGANVTFSNVTVGDTDRFWDAVTAFHTSLLPVVSSGGTVYFLLTQNSLIALDIAVPESNITKVDLVLDGITSKLADVGVNLNITGTTHSGFLDMYNTYIREVAVTTPAAQIAGGRLIPRALIEDAQASRKVTQAFREAVEAGFNILCIALDASKPPLFENAVFPVWRSSLMTCLIQMPWDFDAPWAEMLSRQEQLTQTIMPQIEAATPGGGAYLNEANFQQPDWQETFYGTNYPRLREIKDKYDPQSLLYAMTAVGSESWAAASDGRLCRV